MRTPSCRRTHATELLQAWSPICSQRFVILEDVRKLLVAEEIADAVRRSRPVLQDPGGDSLGDLVLEIALEDSGVLGDDGVGALLNLRSDVACQRIAHILNASGVGHDRSKTEGNPLPSARQSSQRIARSNSGRSRRALRLSQRRLPRQLLRVRHYEIRNGRTSRPPSARAMVASPDRAARRGYLA